MHRKRILIWMMILSCLVSALCLPVSAAELDNGSSEIILSESGEVMADWMAAPAVNCAGVCLMNRNTGEILYEMNGSGMVYPASTTKIMTALLCLKYGNPDDVVTVYASDVAGLMEADASTAGFWIGETLPVRSLMKGMLVLSGCDAANVIARYVSGNIQDFVNLMNQEAAALGCTGTHFTSAHGLHDGSHYTTPADMCRIASAAMAYEEFRSIVGSAHVTVPATNLQGARTMTNTNLLLPNSYSEYSYSFCIGVKTGTTSIAGNCLVSAASRDGTELICALYGAPSLDSRYAQSRALLEWGFSQSPTQSRSIEAAEVTLWETTYLYDGSAKTPGVAVTLNGTVLVENRDYTLSYASNVQAGQATVQITGTGDYVGTQVRSFLIESPLPFLDVPTDFWAFSTIQTAYEQEIVRGVAPDQFAPHKTVSRAEAATLLYRVMGSPETALITSFTDVEEDFAFPAICWAQQAGILRGRSETGFEPAASISRQELATMLYRAGGYPAAGNAGFQTEFADVEQISDYAEQAMAWAVQEGLIRGREIDGVLYLAPQDTASRAETTALVLRFRDWYSHTQEDHPVEWNLTPLGA